jgi:hypothetical protein
MGELLTALGTIGTVLGAWTLASVLAVAPIVWWLRLQAVANEATAGRARSRDFRAAARSATRG